MTERFLRFLIVGLWLFGWIVSAQAEDPSPDAATTSTNELMDMEVTSAARKEQTLSETAAAVFVITQEDIRRSGMTSIPELLRLAPGVNVAQIDASKWAVSVRGFTGRFSNKLLVLIDGRRVYTPLFSGVFWDVQDTLLEDIDRIEVIRGPKAPLWGADAVNGVINIITRQASETQGGLLTTGYGNQEQGFGSLRYGTHLGQSAFVRGYTKYFSRNDSANALGKDAFDNWNMLRGGTRLDWKLSTRDSMTVLGDIYEGHENQMVRKLAPAPSYQTLVPSRTPVSGGDILGRWMRIFNDQSELRLQAYYDRTSRDDIVVGEVRNTMDLDFQHRFKIGQTQEVEWGLGYRYTTDQITNRTETVFSPPSRGDHLYSIFIQDEISLIRDRLRLTMEYRFEHNGYTGVESQPDVRLLWTPRKNQTAWASVSRAVRIPSRLESDGQADLEMFPGNELPVVATLYGNPDIKSEVLIAYEAGYRLKATKRLFLDLAAYYNVYDHLLSLEPGSPRLLQDPPPPHLQVPFLTGNGGKGNVYGAEFWATWNVTKSWRVIPGYTWVRSRLNQTAGGSDTIALVTVSDGPRHQAQVRSQLNLLRSLEFDVLLYAVSCIPGKPVPRYTRVDARLGWQMKQPLRLDLVLQNVQNPAHPEFFSAFGAQSTQVRRSIYGRLTWSF
jgi:iron complex outermembrane receptor protein